MGFEIVVDNGMAKRVCRHLDSVNPGSLSQDRDGSLQGSDRGGLAALGEEKQTLRRPVTTGVQIGVEGAPHGGVERHPARFKPSAGGNVDPSGAFVDGEVLHLDTSRLADADTGVHHELDAGVVPFTHAV